MILALKILSLSLLILACDSKKYHSKKSVEFSETSEPSDNNGNMTKGDSTSDTKNNKDNNTNNDDATSDIIMKTRIIRVTTLPQTRVRMMYLRLYFQSKLSVLKVS